MRGFQFGLFVKDLRESLDLSQVQFARLLGIKFYQDGAQTIHCWEHGKHCPRTETVELIGRLSNEWNRRKAKGDLGWTYLSMAKFMNTRSVCKKEPLRERRELQNMRDRVVVGVKSASAASM